MSNSIRQKRMNALYDYVWSTNNYQRREILTFLLSIISHKQIKEVVDFFNIQLEEDDV